MDYLIEWCMLLVYLKFQFSNDILLVIVLDLGYQFEFVFFCVFKKVIGKSLGEVCCSEQVGVS